MTKKEEKKEYDFGEKEEENINGNKIPVEFHTPKYKEAKAKAIELLESEKYKDVLKPSDFWILVNTYSNKTKAMYSGLIISHDGCLKINDSLEDNLKFKPTCMTLDKEGYNNSLVYTYQCEEQGLYEIGEVSKDNLKNGAYPYAMALKRCFDRVVLKNSKIAYSGIYSDSESDEFLKRNEENIEEKKGSNRILLINRINELELELDIPHEKTLEICKVDSMNKMTDSQLQQCINAMEERLKQVKGVK